MGILGNFFGGEKWGRGGGGGHGVMKIIYFLKNKNVKDHFELMSYTMVLYQVNTSA